MVIAAIVAEYNPFHNGHALHIAAVRQAGATHIAAVMSGNYTQRGSAAIAEKHIRTECAIAGGVDLVLELPTTYAVSTAQRFAFGAVDAAIAMGCVDILSFGSESGNLRLLRAAADAVDSAAVSERLRKYLDSGMTFARARQIAVGEIAGSDVSQLLSSPNDSLAVEYLRALKHRQSAIMPFAVLRRGAGHDSTGSCGGISSATHIRALLRAGSVNEALTLMPPGSADAFLHGYEQELAPYDESRTQTAMLAVLRRMRPEEFADLPDLSEGIEHRIISAVQRATTLSEVYTLAKSKRYPAARLRRVILSAYLGISGDMCRQDIPYLRVLGFNSRGREILSRMKSTASLPFSVSLAHLRDMGSNAARFAELEIRATDLYTLGLPKALPCGYDCTAPVVRVL